MIDIRGSSKSTVRFPFSFSMVWRVVLKRFTLFQIIPIHRMSLVRKMRFVVLDVGWLINQLKILRSIIVLDSVNVVYIFFRSKFPSKLFFHNFSMKKLPPIFIVSKITHLSFVNAISKGKKTLSTSFSGRLQRYITVITSVAHSHILPWKGKTIKEKYS